MGLHVFVDSVRYPRLPLLPIPHVAKQLGSAPHMEIGSAPPSCNRSRPCQQRFRDNVDTQKNPGDFRRLEAAKNLFLGYLQAQTALLVPRYCANKHACGRNPSSTEVPPVASGAGKKGASVVTKVPEVGCCR